jgi:RNA polymerase sigma factor (sigma-70 family)
MDDAQLLRSFVEENSHAAFQSLVTRHIDLVHSAALRRTGGDPHRAEEVTQRVFSDLARKSRSLLRHPLLPAWLHQATRWSAAALHRSEQRRLHHETLAAADSSLGTAASPDEPADWTTLRPILDDALDALNDADRTAILQRFFQQQPFASIANHLGVSENAARMRVERALEKLRARLVRRGLTSTSTALGLALAQHSVTAAPSPLASAVSASACAGAAATGGAGTFATFLLMTKLHAGLATAITLALALSLAWQHRENTRLERTLAKLTAENTTRALSVTALESDLAIREDSLRSLKDSLVATNTTVASLTPEQQERRALDIFIRKGELDGEFAPLFRKLALPPAQLDIFKTLLVERNQAIYDATKLAEKNGVEFASLTEQTGLHDAVTAEIDQRIAARLGHQTLKILHDHIALTPYRDLTLGLTYLSWDEPDFEKRLQPEFDARADAFARLLRETAPAYPELLYRGNNWPMDYPTEFVRAALKLLPPESHTLFSRRAEQIRLQRRLFEIARDAALQGKLKSLSKASARDYPAPDAQSPTP